MLNSCAISCIQRPETGRELKFGTITKASSIKRVLVAGGGPAGMKAASVAAARGHDVILWEKSNLLGGQIKLAQLLPGRSEFGGVTTNLQHELENSGVSVRLNASVTSELVRQIAPDIVVVATGAVPYNAEIEGAGETHVVNAWQVLQSEVNIGGRVVISDWRCDLVGLGLAELLARNGCHVRLAVNGMIPGQTIPQYARDTWLGSLHKLGVEIISHVRLFRIDAEDAYFQHTLSGQPVVLSEVDTLVTALRHSSNTALENLMSNNDLPYHVIGDSPSPRTVEEAVLEGLTIGAKL